MVAYVAENSSADSDFPQRFVAGARSHIGKAIDAVITLDCVKEISLAPPQARMKLIQAVKAVCNCIITPDARSILAMDATDPNPYRTASRVKDLPVDRLDKLEEIITYWDVREFMGHQRFTYDQLRTVLGALEHIRVPKKTAPSFPDFVEELRIGALRSLLDAAVARGALKHPAYRKEQDLEIIWRRCIAYRILTCFLLANEYRRVLGQGTLEGSMTDMRQVIESSYVDGFLTRDRQLFECGQLVNQVVHQPRFQSLSSVSVP